MSNENIFATSEIKKIFNFSSNFEQDNINPDSTGF